jgi:hypothetical protein
MNDDSTLTIELNKKTIKIIARSNKKFSDHEIQISVILGYYWNKNFPVVGKFLELIEKVIKRSISQIFPHNILKLKYQIIADDDLENALSISIEFLEIKADEVDFKILGDLIILKSTNTNTKGTLSKLKKFGRKKKKIIEKEI